MSQEEVVRELNRFCILRRNGNVKVSRKQTKEIGQGKACRPHTEGLGLGVKILLVREGGEEAYNQL